MSWWQVRSRQAGAESIPPGEAEPTKEEVWGRIRTSERCRSHPGSPQVGAAPSTLLSGVTVGRGDASCGKGPARELLRELGPAKL